MSFLRRLRNLGRDEQLAREIERETAFHLRERVEELREAGYSEADAALLARRQFGNRTLQREATREADILTWLDSLRGDIRYALRALRRSPAFAAVAVASLALGIGANTAIYTLLDAVVLRSLPVPHPEELVQVMPSDDDDAGYFSHPLWEQVRDRQSGFRHIAAFGLPRFDVSDGGEVRNVQGQWVGGDYFAMFGIAPAAGRLFTRADDVRGCHAIAVLGHGFWQSEYGGRTDAVGRTISLAGQPFEIVGVTGEGFTGPVVDRETQVFVPLCSEAIIRGEQSSLDRSSSQWLRVIGRRDPTLTLEQVRVRLKTIAPDAYAETVPTHWATADQAKYRTRTLSARSAEMGLSSVRGRYGTALTIMMGAVALVLLIACANIANLLMARAAARQREVAVRLAIGAGRRRLVRQLLTESLLLASLGALAGLVVAHWGSAALVQLISTDTAPVTLDLSLNLRVLGFTALVAAATATIFGLVPAWRGTRVSPQAAMKAGGRGVAEGHSRFAIGKLLVATQVALSLMLLVGAGLLVGSLRNLSTLEAGFTTDRVLLVNADLRRTGLPAPRQLELHDVILERVRMLPGVQSASASDLTPVSGSNWIEEIHVDGYSPAAQQDSVSWFNEVSDQYFATLGTRLLAGRDFDRTDTRTSPKVAIANESAARKFFGGDSALGRQFRTREGDVPSEPFTIVGLVEDAKYATLRQKSVPTIYVSRTQNAADGSYLLIAVRSAENPLALVPSLKSVFEGVDRTIGIEFTTFERQVARSLQRERMMATLSTLFGGVALALSMLGLYGVMTYSVARRRNEIGVRIALGADSGRVVRMVLGDVARVVVVGLTLGVIAALAAGRLIASFLFGLEPSNPAVMASAAGTLALVALGSGLVPAWRAGRVDPVAALREE